MMNRITALAAAWIIAAATPASAHHVVWLDFGTFDLSGWGTVNGHTPPTNGDVTAVRELVIANMVEDWAPFDIYFTRSQPQNGRYTRIFFYAFGVGNSSNATFGCAGGSCCQNGNCTGRGSWSDALSELEVYSASFGFFSAFTGSNATTARIANGIASTASHELGHIMGMSHCYSADDFVSSGTTCSDGYAATSDSNVNWHMMASGTSTGLTMAQRATRDRFFNAHSERRLLYDRLQPRNHWAVLGNTNAGVGRSDLTYGRLQSPTTVEWYNRLSNGAAFGSYSTWSADAGQRADLFFQADVTGDNRDDLIFARVINASTVRWWVKPSNGAAFGSTSLWSSEAGDPGDIFRLADVNADGRADLVYGRPFSSTQVTWYVRLSSGSGFGSFTTWANDAGSRSNLFLVGDVTGDGRADLVAVNRGSGTTVYRSTGSSFTNAGSDNFIFGFSPDIVLLGDADGDGQADLVTGDVNSDTDVDWNVYESQGCSGFGVFGDCFTTLPDQWANGAGDAGDLFRLGDGDGDGRVDLFYARPLGMTSLSGTPDLTWIRWFGRLSTGFSFGSFTIWASDAGDEGDIIP